MSDVDMLISHRLDTLQNAATSAISRLEAFIYGLIQVSELDFEIPVPEDEIDSYDKIKDILDIARRLVPVAKELQFPDELPIEVPSVNINEIGDIEFPTLEISEPTITYPEPPEFSNTKEPPLFSGIEYSSLPELSYLDLPKIPAIDTSISFPDYIEPEYPSWDGVRPTINMETPDVEFKFTEQPYKSRLKDALESSLLEDITIGGYGIEPLDEIALRERAKDAELKASQIALDNINRNLSLSGFSIPTGSLVKLQQSYMQESLDKVCQRYRDIEIHRAELFRDNRQFAMTTSLQFIQMEINYFITVMDRLLSAEIASVDAAVKVFQLLANRYNMELEAYKTDAQVYNTRMQAVGLQIEAYKSKIENIRIEQDAKKVLIDIYNAQVNGVIAIDNRNNLKVEAHKRLMEIEALKVEIYKAQIEAYMKYVQTDQLKVELYKAQMQAETQKVEVYKTQMMAHEIKYKEAEVKANIKKTQLDAEIAKANVDIELYKQKLNKYTAEMSRAYDAIELELRKHSSKVQAYAAEIGAISETAKLLVANDTNKVTISSKAAEIAIEKAKLELTQLEKIVSLRQSGISAIASAQSVVAGGITSALNGWIGLEKTVTVEE